jgi:ribosomal protein L22
MAERKKATQPETGTAAKKPEAEAKRETEAKRDASKKSPATKTAGGSSGAKGRGGSKAAAKTEQKSAEKAKPKSRSKAKPKAESKPKPKPTAKPKTQAKPKSEAKPKATTKPKAEKEAPKPPVVNARARYVRVAPRKARLIADQVRGMHVDDARTLLRFSSRGAARDIAKLIDSATANAEANHDLVADELRVTDITVDEGPTLRRYRPRALGRATRINKRTSHIHVALTPED